MSQVSKRIDNLGKFLDEKELDLKNGKITEDNLPNIFSNIKTSLACLYSGGCPKVKKGKVTGLKGLWKDLPIDEGDDNELNKIIALHRRAIKFYEQALTMLVKPEEGEVKNVRGGDVITANEKPTREELLSAIQKFVLNENYLPSIEDGKRIYKMCAYASSRNWKIAGITFVVVIVIGVAAGVLYFIFGRSNCEDECCDETGFEITDSDIGVDIVSCSEAYSMSFS